MMKKLSLLRYLKFTFLALPYFKTELMLHSKKGRVAKPYLVWCLVHYNYCANNPKTVQTRGIDTPKICGYKQLQTTLSLFWEANSDAV